jgi:hypothetical protein
LEEEEEAEAESKAKKLHKLAITKHGRFLPLGHFFKNIAGNLDWGLKTTHPPPA